MPAEIKPRYVAEVTVSGGREGHAVSSDGVLDVQLRRPKTNGVSEGTNPEQLFGAAWGACFLGALGKVAGDTGVDVSQARVEIAVALGEDLTNGGNAIEATIGVVIPGLDLHQAQDLADQAHEICPYSKATRNSIGVDVVAISDEP